MAYTYFCSDHVLNRIPGDAPKGRHASLARVICGALRMPGNPCDSKCGPRTAPCMPRACPTIPGACVKQLPVAEPVQRGVSLWFHMHSQRDTRDDSCYYRGSGRCPGLCHIACLVYIIIVLILLYLHIYCTVIKSWFKFNIIFNYIILYNISLYAVHWSQICLVLFWFHGCLVHLPSVIIKLVTLPCVSLCWSSLV